MLTASDSSPGTEPILKNELRAGSWGPSGGFGIIGANQPMNEMPRRTGHTLGRRDTDWTCNAQSFTTTPALNNSVW